MNISADMKTNVNRKRIVNIGFLLLLPVLLLMNMLFLSPSFGKSLAPQTIIESHRVFGTGFDCTYSMATADFDADGYLDIFYGNSKSLCDQELNFDPQDKIAFNRPEGRILGLFPIDSTRPVGSSLEDTLDVAVGDMNGDGSVDVIVASGNIDSGALPSGGQNYIYYNDGNGEFNFGPDIDCNSKNVRCFGDANELTSAVAVADMDGNGWLDIIESSTRIAITPPFDIELFEATKISYNENGVFAEPITIEKSVPILKDISYPPFSLTLSDLFIALNIEIADIDKNGDLDVITARTAVTISNSGPEFSGVANTIYLQNSGAFVESKLDGEFISRGLAIGDLNNDSWPDIIVGNGFPFEDDNTPENDLLLEPNFIYLNDQNGQFGAATPLGTRVDMTMGVAVGDLNQDGLLDIATGNFGGINEIFLNQGGGSFTLDPTDTFGTTGNGTTSLIVGEANLDSAPDLILGNVGQNIVYLNDQSIDFLDSSILNITDETLVPNDITLADLNNDDILEVIVATDEEDLYFQLNSLGVYEKYVIDPLSARTQKIGAADFDSNGYIDLIRGTWEGASEIFFNDGSGGFTSKIIEDTLNQTVGIEIADFNKDGHVDFVLINRDNLDQVYLNDGSGNFSDSYSLGSITNLSAQGVTGDVDGDGDIDLIVSNEDFGQPYVLYLNSGNGQFHQNSIDCSASNSLTICFGSETDATRGLSLGDVNGDGLPDLIAGNIGQQNKIYINENGSFNSQNLRFYGNGSDFTNKTIIHDMNGDGYLDLVLSNGFVIERQGAFPQANQNIIYFNDGQGYFFTDNSTGFDAPDGVTLATAIGDMDGNGSPDMVVGNWKEFPKIYLNPHGRSNHLLNNLPAIKINAPVSTASTDSGMTPSVLSGRVITIPFIVKDLEANTVGYVKGYYSVDGGDNWREAVSAQGQMVNLATSPQGTKHQFLWDVYASSFWGQSDNVVFRLEIFEQFPPVEEVGTHKYPNYIGSQFSQASVSSTSFPFRVRGNQLRVINKDLDSTPVEGAIVYRLNSQFSPGQPYSDFSDNSYRTDDNGFLAGRGVLSSEDLLIALWADPNSGITFTDKISAFLTSAQPTQNGLDLSSVQSQLGVQDLEISVENKLLLLNLDVTLEWDARKDSGYLNQLELDIQRASEILFDLTNGQMALGEISIYQNRENWYSSDIVIYARNDHRPNANLGGIVTQPITTSAIVSGENGFETKSIVDAILPGQIRMGANWNRFGNISGNIGEDWPRALAHEIGHFALFQMDNYLGVNKGGLIIEIDCAGSVMTNAYQPAYSEFLSKESSISPYKWDGQCLNTLSNQFTNRSDWDTILEFYKFYSSTNIDKTIDGPSSLPIQVTKIIQFPVEVEHSTIPDLFVNLTVPDDILLSANHIQGYLIKKGDSATDADDRIIEMGNPRANLIRVRGASEGDLFCLIGVPSNSLEMATGCNNLSGSPSASVDMTLHAGWNPDIRVTPVNSVTLDIEVKQQLDDGENMYVQIMPSYRPTDTVRSLKVKLDKKDEDTYSVSLDFPMTIFSGEVVVSAGLNESDTDSGKLAIQSFFLAFGWDGNQFRGFGTNQFLGWDGNQFRGFGGNQFRGFGGDQLRAFNSNYETWGVPTTSTDGQVVLFNTQNIFAGNFAAILQEVNVIPNFKEFPYLTPVGNAYRFELDDNSNETNALQTTVIQFLYLENDLPFIDENDLRLYFSPDDGLSWERIENSEIDPLRNLASAKIRGEGIYALMATKQYEAYPANTWQYFTYPRMDSASVTETLKSIDGKYSIIYQRKLNQRGIRFNGQFTLRMFLRT